MKIIYIAGDGRSGSTLLENVLANADGTIGIGECYRFWRRYYEGDSLCGCGDIIVSCPLWSHVHNTLTSEIEDYDPSDFWNKIQYLLKYKNAGKAKEILAQPDWSSFVKGVKLFYQCIADKTGKKILIDSSKSIGWLNILITLNFCEVTILHLERSLPEVANSWKKKVRLPEYTDKTVYMPIKSDWVIAKNWLKIKYFMRRFKSLPGYTFVSYHSFVSDPNAWLAKMEEWTGATLKLNSLDVHFNHAIGGNPMRSNTKGNLRIENRKASLDHLNFFNRIFFTGLHKISILIQ
ncbi:hypothetical protein POV27_11085 [Aureisphaera galaxeae]|uniref:hypothetical protein n=1 Tax=Aureisphaera galaxeae TaxID=1538023 RepID=UPI002350B3AB|nr:hypothetical protein [Aureisphaera galaxeae]MDC8004594.1 hypothetical protein [Aureisphaera galaxeae]